MTGSDTWGQLLRALEAKARRRVLVALLELPHPDETVNVPDDIRGGDLDIESLEANLYHRHLPVLESSGYIRWDRDAGEVSVGDSFDEIRPVLRLLHDNRESLPDGWV